MKHLRFVWLALPTAAVGACSSASAGSSGDTVSEFDGTWSCMIEGQSQPVDLGTYSYCTRLDTHANGPDGPWLTCTYAISGNTATPVSCGAQVTMGTLAVSADEVPGPDGECNRRSSLGKKGRAPVRGAAFFVRRVER
jgi:hypothetical protein